MRVGALLFVLLAIAAPARAAGDPICADRPGKSTPTCTVAPGHWQIETGLADWTVQKAGGERQALTVIGETTVRFGLTDRSDFEVDLTPWQHASDRGPGVREKASGIGDVSLLYKHRLTSGDSPVQLAVMPVMKLPTAKRALGNGKLEGALLIPVDLALGQSPFSLNFTPEVDWTADSDGHGHHAAMVQVASLGWQANDRLSLSAEIWGQWDYDRLGTTRQASAGGSAAYLLDKDVQIDAGADFGLNRATPDAELYFGISKRF